MEYGFQYVDLTAELLGRKDETEIYRKDDPGQDLSKRLAAMSC